MGDWASNIDRLVVEEGLWERPELRPVANDSPKSFLFFSPTPWQRGTLERMMSVALRLRGHDVDDVYCGGGYPACGMEHVDRPRPSCEVCQKMAVRWFRMWRLPELSTAAFTEPGDLEYAESVVAGLDMESLYSADWQGCLKVLHKGLPLGRRVYESTHWIFSGRLDDTPEFRDCAYKNALTYVMQLLVAERMFERKAYDAVVLCNGKVIESGALMDLAQQRGIRVVTWEGHFVFGAETPAFEWDTSDVWDTLKDVPLTEEQEAAVMEFYDRWKRSENTPFVYFNQPITDVERIRREVGFRKDSYKIVLFPNLTIETAVIGCNLAFDSMLEWICYCIDYARDNPDIDLIIRAHPNERNINPEYPTKTYVPEEIAKVYETLPPNVYVIEGISEIYSYSLLPLADMAMTYTGTLTLEAPLYGYQCVACGASPYLGKGFSIDIHETGTLKALLDARKNVNKATPEQMDLAKRCAHLVRNRLLALEVDFYREQGEVFTIDSVHMLRPGGHPFIENVCESLVHGYPFIDLKAQYRVPLVVSPGKDMADPQWLDRLASRLDGLPLDRAAALNETLREQAFFARTLHCHALPLVREVRLGAEGSMEPSLLTALLDQLRPYAQHLNGGTGTLRFVLEGAPRNPEALAADVRLVLERGLGVEIQGPAQVADALRTVLGPDMDRVRLCVDGISGNTPAPAEPEYVPDGSPCFSLWREVAVLADGRVVPSKAAARNGCVLGDLRTQTLAGVWNAGPMRELRKAQLSGRHGGAPCGFGDGEPDCLAPDWRGYVDQRTPALTLLQSVLS